MTRYSLDFKLKAIKLVKQGNTITEVAKMLNL